jgi:DNA-binding beta-propeller fold protein YncE
MLAALCSALAWTSISVANPQKEQPLDAIEKSDLNRDRQIDLNDLDMFGSRYLQSNWKVIDWCGFYDATLMGLKFDARARKVKDKKDKKNKGKPTDYYKKHFRLLLTFINAEYSCDADPQPDPDMLAIENEPRYLMRMAIASDGSGDVFITDPMVGSLFIYSADFVLKGEIKGLAMPLGIAVDSNGYLLVGNDGRDNVEVYDPANGNLVAIFADGVLMPNSITTGANGNIYVTDSRDHKVKVFDSEYNFIRNIGSHGLAEHELNFPVDTEVITRFVDGTPVQEVFVADQGNQRVKIYDETGNYQGSIGPGRCSWFGGCRPPTLKRIQALDSGPSGRLHILDSFSATVSMIEPSTGGYLGGYGEYGEGAGYLSVPMGLVVSGAGEPIVTAGDNSRIEVYPQQ